MNQKTSVPFEGILVLTWQSGGDGNFGVDVYIQFY